MEDNKRRYSKLRQFLLVVFFGVTMLGVYLAAINVLLVAPKPDAILHPLRPILHSTQQFRLEDSSNDGFNSGIQRQPEVVTVSRVGLHNPEPIPQTTVGSTPTSGDDVTPLSGDDESTNSKTDPDAGHTDHVTAAETVFRSRTEGNDKELDIASVESKAFNNSTPAKGKNDTMTPMQQFQQQLILSSKSGINPSSLSRLSVQAQFADETVPLDPTVSPLRKPRIVLLVAYWRTGSTLTATILAHNEQTFYVFEPLHGIYEERDKNGHLVYLNGTHRPIVNNTLDNSWSLDTMMRYMSCDLTQLDLGSLNDKFHRFQSKNMTSFYGCLQRLRPVSVHGIKTCASLAQLPCLGAKFRLFKTIRLSMRNVKELVKLFPDIKIVHLLRDPRGMFLSQLITGKQDFRSRVNSSVTVRRFCERIMGDLKSSVRIMVTSPQNIMTLLYEDLARNPIETSKRLYKFLGMTMSDSVLAFVKNSTTMGLAHNGQYRTTRGNSSRTASKWRERMPMRYVSMIDKQCQDLYSILGYRPFTSVLKLRNARYPSQVAVNITKNILALL